MGGVCAGATAHGVQSPEGAVSSARPGFFLSKDELLNGDLSAEDVSEHGPLTPIQQVEPKRDTARPTSPYCFVVRQTLRGHHNPESRMEHSRCWHEAALDLSPGVRKCI